MFLDCEKKVENRDRTHADTGEHANKAPGFNTFLLQRIKMF